MQGKYVKILTVISAFILIFLFFQTGAHEYLTLGEIKAKKDELIDFYCQNMLLSIVVYLISYLLIAALSLPGAALMTLLGGAIFGLGLGVVLVSFASTTGATIAFLVARYLLRDSIQTKFGDKLKNVNERLEKEGTLYLFTLRLIPAFPFFLINILMGLTPIRVSTFFFVSQIGMLPGTIVYVNAGTQLSEIESLKGILAFDLILSFVLIGILPLIAQKTLGFFKEKRKMQDRV